MLIWFVLLGCLMLSSPGVAVDFVFQPDTSEGDVGESVWLSGQIGASELMRSFTIYLQYDTNRIDLLEPPVAGTLIAGRQGLDFRYLDHVPSEPDWLEIGATVFSTDFWAGPGELFRVRFLLRSCADVVISAPFGVAFRTSGNVYVLGTYDPPAILICDRIPASITQLTIIPAPSSVTLRWPSVHLDTLGRPLIQTPVYLIYREPILPPQPESLIATIPDTFFIDPFQTGDEYIYRVTVQTSP